MSAIKTPEAPEGSLIRSITKRKFAVLQPIAPPPTYFEREIGWRAEVIESPDTNPGQKVLARRGLAVVFQEAVRSGVNPLPITPEQARKLIFSGPHE